jgi:23S rRNA (adenine2503-C2)-methyltransferase
VSGAHAQALFRALHQHLDPGLAGRDAFAGPLQRWIEARPGRCGESIELVATTPSADGWTRKFLFELEDGVRIESVLMGFPGRFTGCLSSQAGCAMGCVFCATGRAGFSRHLRAGEIIAQAHYLESWVRSRHAGRLRNLVLMGMGEPLHNFDEVMRALAILTDTRGLDIGPARVTVSTVGHVPGIRRLARHPLGCTLAVSLHAADDERRGRLVPVNQRWPLAELLDACREYSALRGERVFIAWTLIGGVNDDADQARQLGALLRGMDVHVNLIPLNPVDEFRFTAPPAARVIEFQRILQAAGLPSTIRQRRGIDVAAGCGQLAGSRRPAPSMPR